MPKQNKIFRLKLKLEGIIQNGETTRIPIYASSQMIIGIDQIKPISDILSQNLNRFLKTTLIKNNKEQN